MSKVFIGGSYKGGRNVGGQDITSGITTNKNNKKTTTKKDDSDTKKGKQTFKSKFLYSGSKGVDEDVDKKNYNNPSKHKLRNQFDYLSDKYYGGSKEDFAKTSQGQVLLGYLQNVDATRGGGRGGDIDTLEKIEQAYKTGEISDEDYKTIKQAVGGGIEAIRNLPMDVLRNQPEFKNRTGILTSPEYFRFSQLLQSQNPTEYNKARPFSSGALPRTIVNLITRPITAVGGGIMDSLDSLGVINRTEKPVIPPLGSDEFLSQDLFANLPTQLIDQGGVNEVAQSIINNEQTTPVLPEDEVAFNTDSVFPGFGFDSTGNVVPLDGTGITNQMLTGFNV